MSNVEQLDSKDLADFSSFAAKKTQIHQLIDQVKSTPAIKFCEPLPPDKPVWTKTDIERLQLQQYAWEEEAEHFETSDFTRLRHLAKAASATDRAMSLEDVNIIEVALETLFAFDTLRHLFKQRSRHLDLYAIRLQWHALLDSAQKDSQALATELPKFLAKARWSLQPNGAARRQNRFSPTSKNQTSHSTKRGSQTSSSMSRQMRNDIIMLELARHTQRIHTLTHSTIANSGKVLDRLMDVSHVRLPDVFLDLQEQLEESVSKLCDGLTPFLTALVAQWKAADEISWSLDQLTLDAHATCRDIDAAVLKIPSQSEADVFFSRSSLLYEQLSTLTRKVADRLFLPMPTHSNHPDQPECNAKVEKWLQAALKSASAQTAQISQSIASYQKAFQALVQSESLCASIDATIETYSAFRESYDAIKPTLPSLDDESGLADGSFTKYESKHLDELIDRIRREEATSSDLLLQATSNLNDLVACGVDPNARNQLRECIYKFAAAKIQLSTFLRDLCMMNERIRSCCEVLSILHNFEDLVRLHVEEYRKCLYAKLWKPDKISDLDTDHHLDRTKSLKEEINNKLSPVLDVTHTLLHDKHPHIYSHLCQAAFRCRTQFRSLLLLDCLIQAADSQCSAVMEKSARAADLRGELLRTIEQIKGSNAFRVGEHAMEEDVLSKKQSVELFLSTYHKSIRFLSIASIEDHLDLDDLPLQFLPARSSFSDVADGCGEGIDIDFTNHNDQIRTFLNTLALSLKSLLQELDDRIQLERKMTDFRAICENFDQLRTNGQKDLQHFSHVVDTYLNKLSMYSESSAIELLACLERDRTPAMKKVAGSIFDMQQALAILVSLSQEINSESEISNAVSFRRSSADEIVQAFEREKVHLCQFETELQDHLEAAHRRAEEEDRRRKLLIAAVDRWVEDAKVIQISMKQLTSECVGMKESLHVIELACDKAKNMRDVDQQADSLEITQTDLRTLLTASDQLEHQLSELYNSIPSAALCSEMASQLTAHDQQRRDRFSTVMQQQATLAKTINLLRQSCEEERQKERRKQEVRTILQNLGGQLDSLSGLLHDIAATKADVSSQRLEDAIVSLHTALDTAKFLLNDRCTAISSSLRAVTESLQDDPEEELPNRCRELHKQLCLYEERLKAYIREILDMVNRIPQIGIPLRDTVEAKEVEVLKPPMRRSASSLEGSSVSTLAEVAEILADLHRSVDSFFITSAKLPTEQDVEYLERHMSHTRAKIQNVSLDKAQDAEIVNAFKGFDLDLIQARGLAEFERTAKQGDQVLSDLLEIIDTHDSGLLHPKVVEASEHAEFAMTRLAQALSSLERPDCRSQLIADRLRVTWCEMTSLLKDPRDPPRPMLYDSDSNGISSDISFLRSSDELGIGKCKRQASDETQIPFPSSKKNYTAQLSLIPRRPSIQNMTVFNDLAGGKRSLYLSGSSSSGSISRLSSLTSPSTSSMMRRSFSTQNLNNPRKSFRSFTDTTPKSNRHTYTASTRAVDIAVASIVNQLKGAAIPIKAVDTADTSGNYVCKNLLRFKSVTLQYIGDRLCFCRILRSRMVMVRVGGGWTELGRFLREHFAHMLDIPAPSTTKSIRNKISPCNSSSLEDKLDGGSPDSPSLLQMIRAEPNDGSPRLKKWQ